MKKRPGKIKRNRQELSKKKRGKIAGSSLIKKGLPDKDEERDFGGLPDRGFDHLLGCGG